MSIRFDDIMPDPCDEERAHVARAGACLDDPDMVLALADLDRALARLVDRLDAVFGAHRPSAALVRPPRDRSRP